MALEGKDNVDREIVEAIQDGVGRALLRAHQAVTFSNPVDTGYSRARWEPSVTVPPPDGPADRPSRNLAQAQAAGIFSKNRAKVQAIFDSYRLDQGLAYLVNNVEYITSLNEGSSAQAPAMFVEQAVELAAKRTERELRRRR